MVTITCPWCEEDGLVLFAELEARDASFTCAECGTSVELVDEPPTLELAA